VVRDPWSVARLKTESQRDGYPGVKARPLDEKVHLYWKDFGLTVGIFSEPGYGRTTKLHLLEIAPSGIIAGRRFSYGDSHRRYEACRSRTTIGLHRNGLPGWNTESVA
jgi:hypothetical protein